MLTKEKIFAITNRHGARSGPANMASALTPHVGAKGASLIANYYEKWGKLKHNYSDGTSPSFTSIVAKEREFSQPRMHTAMHEAGHCAMVLDCGGIVNEVSAHANGGECFFNDKGLTMEQLVEVSLAGYIAAKDHYEDSHALEFDVNGGDRGNILSDVRKRMRERGEPEASDEAILSYAYSFEDIVAHALSLRCHFVNALADHLFQYGYASGATVHELWNRLYVPQY